MDNIDVEEGGSCTGVVATHAKSEASQAARGEGSKVAGQQRLPARFRLAKPVFDVRAPGSHSEIRRISGSMACSVNLERNRDDDPVVMVAKSRYRMQAAASCALLSLAVLIGLQESVVFGNIFPQP